MELLEKEEWEIFHSNSTVISNESHENFQSNSIENSLETFRISTIGTEREREREKGNNLKSLHLERRTLMFYNIYNEYIFFS